jgi:FPC/CPF motif-containing protein YcgG
METGQQKKAKIIKSEWLAENRKIFEQKLKGRGNKFTCVVSKDTWLGLLMFSSEYYFATRHSLKSKNEIIQKLLELAKIEETGDISLGDFFSSFGYIKVK